MINKSLPPVRIPCFTVKIDCNLTKRPLKSASLNFSLNRDAEREIIFHESCKSGYIIGE